MPAFENNKHKGITSRLAAFLVKTYGNLYHGSIEALGPLLKSQRSRFDPALGSGIMRGCAQISMLFPAKICDAGWQGADSEVQISDCRAETGSVIDSIKLWVGAPFFRRGWWKFYPCRWKFYACG